MQDIPGHMLEGALSNLSTCPRIHLVYIAGGKSLGGKVSSTNLWFGEEEGGGGGGGGGGE